MRRAYRQNSHSKARYTISEFNLYLNININYPKAENGASGSEYESSLHCGIPVHTYNGYGVSSVNGVLVYDSRHPC